MAIVSKASKASSPNVKIQDVPDPLTIGTAIQVGDNVAVPFTTPATGGTPAIYRAVSTPGGFEGTASSSPVLVPGLSEGTQYSFTVRGETQSGASAGYSNASNFATVDYGAMQLIGSTLMATTTSFVDLLNIPQTYKHLQIRYTARDTSANTTRGMFLEVNGNTVTGANSEHYMRGSTGGSTTGTGSTNLGRFDWSDVPGATSATASAFASGIMDILDYTSTSKLKVFKLLHGVNISESNQVMLWSGMWNSTSAITSMRIYTNTAFAAGSRVSIYGIKG